MTRAQSHEQLEFSRFLGPIQQEAQKRAANKRQRRRIRDQDPEEILHATCRVLQRVNLTFHTYNLMLAAAKIAGPTTIATLAIATGMSPNAIRLQLIRSEWFEKVQTDPPIYYVLVPGADRKLQSISHNLTRELAAF